MIRSILALLFLGLCYFSNAQQTISITVRNINSGELQGLVPVTIENESIGYLQNAQADVNGFLKLNVSSTGAFKVYAGKSHLYYSADTAFVQVRSNQSASVEILIQENKFELPEVILEGKRYSVTKLNSVNAEVSSELSTEEIVKLPIEGRDITRALYRLPNVSQATGFYPEAPNVAINGANSLFTNYLIDGFDNNENFLGGMRFNIPVGFSENIQVLTNNFSAEYGNSANGIINVTSKGGSNETSGEVFYLTRPGPVIDASSPYAQRDLSGNQVKDGFQRQQLGFGIGGALVPNKTFYYLNYEQTYDIKDNLLNVPQLGINETVRGINSFGYLSAKVDEFWNSKMHSSIRMNLGRVAIERQGGGLEGGVAFPSAANTQLRNSFTVASKNEYYGENFTIQTNYQYATFNWNYANATNPNQPNVTVLDPDYQTIALLGHPGYLFNEYEATHQFQQKLTYDIKKHHLVFGAEFKSSNFQLFGGGNPNGSYTALLNEAQLTSLKEQNLGAGLSIYDIPNDVFSDYAIELRSAALEKRQNITSFYLEDQWQASALLSINLGLRYDYDNLSVGGGSKGDYNNIAPRLSANYKLNEKSSIRAGYGIFYEKILYAVFSDAMQQSSNNEHFKLQIQELIKQGILPEDTDLDKALTEGNLTANAVNVDYLNGPSAESFNEYRESVFSNERRILNPNGYQNPYSHQFTLGYQNQVNKNTLFYVDVVHNRSYNLFRLRNLNAAEPYPIDPNNVQVRYYGDADVTRPIPIYRSSYAFINDSVIKGVARNIVMTETAGRSNYYAASFTLNKEKGQDKYAYRLSYTLSRLENNTEDINFRAMDANDFEAEWGPSINDRTHLINAFIIYEPIKNLNVTVAALLQSGQPINRIPDALLYGTTDLNGDGRSFGDAYVGNSDRSPGESRNSDRLPWSKTIDLSASYNFNFKSSKNLEIRADVFNLLNTVNLSGYSNNATQSNQIQVGPASSGSFVARNAAPPRQFQFGLRYKF
jgi:outer membrane receptor for ferrienterochelin and colicin